MTCAGHMIPNSLSRGLWTIWPSFGTFRKVCVSVPYVTMCGCGYYMYMGLYD